MGCAQMGASASLRLPVASEAARSRHALMPAAAPARRSAAAAAAALYPRFDASPAPPIDFVRAPPAAGLWPLRCVHACLSQPLSAPAHTGCEIFVRCMGRMGQHNILSALENEGRKDEAKQEPFDRAGIRPPLPLSVKRCASRTAGVPAGGGAAAAGRLAHGQLPGPAAAAGGRPGVRGGAAGAGAPAAAAGAGAGAAGGGGAALG